MNNLRLILLGIGIVIIASIYIWETLKRQHSRQRFPEHGSDDHAIADLRITPRIDTEDDYSGAIADLNEVLANTKSMDTEMPAIQGALQFEPGKEEYGVQNASVPEADSEEEHTPSAGDERSPQDNIQHAVINEPTIILYVTASHIKAFTGTEIRQAADTVGMEYGVMDIFHHFGVGQMRSKYPLFSMANMFEPGNFNLDELGSLTTRGIVLLMYRPTQVDGQVVFELLLNTAQRLADMLGGEIRGSNHNLLTEPEINTLRGRARQIA
jgi:cell division protein ZipA